MKLLMPLFAIVLSLVSCKKEHQSILESTINVAVAKSEPSFLENYFLDQDISKVREKYKGSFEKKECFKDAKKMCSDKGIKCSCYNVILASTQYYGRNVFFVESNNKVVLQFDRLTAMPFMYNKLEEAYAWYGDSVPDKIYELPDSVQGRKNFMISWDLKDGHVSSLVSCPLERVAGALKVNRKLRMCLVHNSKMSRIDKYIPSKNEKISNLVY